MDQGRPGFHYAFEHRLGVDPDLILGVGVGPEFEEMEQVVEVDLPVPLGVVVERQVHPGQLAGQPVPVRVHGVSVRVLVEHLLVVAVGAFGVLPEQLLHPRGLLGRERSAAALPVALGLGRDHVLTRHVELAVEDGVAGGDLVDAGGAVPDPLSGYEDGELHVELYLAHFERGRVAHAHQVVDQPPVVGDAAGPPAV